ncbi:MAG: TRAP transporter substrate-binding protein [Rhodospirillaceae bacterium]|jgi:TRAP-type C4-dicarboxylate transport system substrate-binding protein|nr:TRAP transporter substrate-binding protein [Rhodospirillaceae bacterium]MBT5457091.1 TRAP transporter substrate-binding protein [Rhodospirillaceae bacterium]
MFTLRNALAVSAVGAFAFVAAIWAVPSATLAADLKLAHFTSPKHPMDRLFMRPWTKRVQTMSAGSLNIKIFPGGKLGKGPRAQYKRAIDGVADMTFGLQGYTSKIFKRTTMVELPALASSSGELVRKFWKVYRTHMSPEYKKVKVLAVWVGEAPVFMTRNKPIKTLDDIKGLKIRTPSANQSRWLKALGATPVSFPVTQMYRALETGRVDALLVPPSVIRSFKIGEVAKYFTTGLGGAFGRSPFFVVMNKKSWKNLDSSHKIIIDRTTGAEWSAKATAIYEKAGAGGLKSVSGTGKHQILSFSDADKAKMKAILIKARGKYVEELEKQGIPAKAIIAAMGSSS